MLTFCTGHIFSLLMVWWIVFNLLASRRRILKVCSVYSAKEYIRVDRVCTPFQIVSSLAILKESATLLFNPLSKKGWHLMYLNVYLVFDMRKDRLIIIRIISSTKPMQLMLNIVQKESAS